MNEEHIPSLHSIVDQLQVRLEYVRAHGSAAEASALTVAKEAIVDHVMREDRQWGWINLVLTRIREGRGNAA